MPSVLAQESAVVPSAAIDQLKQTIGQRVELGTILGGDYASAGGIYSFRGGSVADLSLTKLGGGGDITAPRPLGFWGLQWAPALQGNLGRFQTDNQFQTDYLAGNQASYDTLAIQGGGGVRIYFTDGLSLAPLCSGLYAHTENEFTSGTPLGDAIKTTLGGSLVDWTVDSWSVVPGAQLRYQWTWCRTQFDFRSTFYYWHTESFDSSSPLVSLKGDSYTWENKLDADVPLGLNWLGGEIRTGGFASRTELYGTVAENLPMDGYYTFNGRLVFDPQGKLWVVRWFGFGASYFLGEHFHGWSAGLDLSLKF